MLACDFFTIETVCLEIWYVRFFIELGSRCVHLADCTKNPECAWVTQQARQLVWQVDDEAKPPCASSFITVTADSSVASTKPSSQQILKSSAPPFEHRKSMLWKNARFARYVK